MRRDLNKRRISLQGEQERERGSGAMAVGSEGGKRTCSEGEGNNNPVSKGFRSSRKDVKKKKYGAMDRGGLA